MGGNRKSRKGVTQLVMAASKCELFWNARKAGETAVFPPTIALAAGQLPLYTNKSLNEKVKF